jgi:transcriptional regulator with XRE-family HTH domain
MSTKYAPFIRALRGKRGLTQSLVAKRLSMSRQSYMSIERGEKEMTLLEADRLCELYGISIEELSKAIVPHYEKYKQMILAFLRAESSAGDGKIPKTKLAKLLYLADFAWYYNHLTSISGMQYLRRTYGPVPDPYFRALAELEEDGKINTNHKGDAILVQLGKGVRQRLDLLEDKEKELIKKISNKWRNSRTQEIVNFTHEQLPYKICAPDEVIPYELITQEDPEYVY